MKGPKIPKANHTFIDVLVKNTDFNPFRDEFPPTAKYYFKRKKKLRREVGTEIIEIPYVSWVKGWVKALHCLEKSTKKCDFVAINKKAYHKIIKKLHKKGLAHYIP